MKREDQKEVEEEEGGGEGEGEEEEDVDSSNPRRRKRRRIVDSDDEGQEREDLDDRKGSVGRAVEEEGGVHAELGASTSGRGGGKIRASKKPFDEDVEEAKPKLVSETIGAGEAEEEGVGGRGSEDEGEEGEEVEEEEEEEEKEEEIKGAKKIAAIFKKPTEAALEGKVRWKEGEPVPYSALAQAFSEIQATTKRLEITEILTQLLVRVIRKSPDNLLQVVYLCINRLCPDYEGLELGIGEGLLVKAIAQSTGRPIAKIKKELELRGDLGLVALNSRQKQPTMFKSAALKVPTVFKQLKEIASVSGNKSQDKKIGIIMKLLASCQGEEPKFLIRSLEGKLRIGLAERSVLVALARSIVISKLGESIRRMDQASLAEKLEEGTEIVKSVFSELPSYDAVIPALLQGGVEGLRETCKLTPGVPLKPMLAKPTKAIAEVLDRFEGQPFTCEYKYDGERAQVHLLPNGRLAVFSRNSEDMSVKYPDLVEQIPRCITGEVRSFVLDAEATAWKPEQRDQDGKTVEAGRLLPFQELSRRKRKDVKAEDIKVRVKLFGFDLLYLNGRPLLHLPLVERRQLLRSSFLPVLDEFDFAKSEDCTSVEEIQNLLEASVSEGCEGLMVKMVQGPDSTYEPSRRSMNWLKLKKDYLAGTGDSLDLVVVGGYHGKGKRTKVYGAFLLACYDPENEVYQSVCKIGTGFTEQELESHHTTLSQLEVQNRKGYYDLGEAKPDVFFQPKVVWEVLAADLSLSPVYTAAKGLIDHRGVSLRFPRFIRIREDKRPEDATGPEQIESMYRSQAVSNGGKVKGSKDDDDGFW
ncbi:ATP-dependent DNA ligase [Violaceomyces palustris]|uniref:ATP-dependent DNA ligase n=1 Tax=Violaceomyces palustris TaxID=1673888 RepID=A0ACD0P4Y2_9BASI|nr:ATP-dependent DNA ligase [Violaceomyces palustris]